MGSWKIHSLQKKKRALKFKFPDKIWGKKNIRQKKNKRSGWPPGKLKGTSNIPPFPGGFFFWRGGSAQAAQEEKKKLAEKRKARPLRSWFDDFGGCAISGELEVA